MRFQRAALFAVWAIVSALAIAGFATFSTPNEGTPATGLAPSNSDLGANAGAVAALAFAYSGGADARLESPTVSLPEPAEAAPSATTNRQIGTTFVRNRSLNEAQVRTVVEVFFLPEDVDRAVRLAWCESSFNPNAINSSSGASGLFQHLPEHWTDRSAAAGYPGSDIRDPEANVAVAAWMVYNLADSWSHWSCVG